MSQAQITPEQQAALNAAILDEYERSAQLRKILPEVDMPGATYGVVVPKITGNTLAMNDYELVKPVTLSIELSFAPIFLDDLDGMLTLARAAAKRVAIVEDRLIAFGSSTFPNPSGGPTLSQSNGVTITNMPARSLFWPGLNAAGTKPTQTNTNKATLYEVLPGALQALQSDGYHEPFVGVYGSSAATAIAGYSAEQVRGFEALEASVQVPGADVDFAANRFNSGTAVELRADAIFLSTDSLGCDLVRVSKPSGSARGYDDQGKLRYFVEEQFLLRIKDDAALYRVGFDSTGSHHYRVTPPS